MATKKTDKKEPIVHPGEPIQGIQVAMMTT
jgi:hypothetical protein